MARLVPIERGVHSRGANLPVDTFNEAKTCKSLQGVLRVAVFGITGGEGGRKESARIADAVRFVSARIGKLELCAFGRHTDDCESMLRESLREDPVDIQVKGVLPPEEVVRELCSADAMLFVRGLYLVAGAAPSPALHAGCR